jgi:hypothetical protein
MVDKDVDGVTFLDSDDQYAPRLVEYAVQSIARMRERWPWWWLRVGLKVKWDASGEVIARMRAADLFARGEYVLGQDTWRMHNGWMTRWGGVGGDMHGLFLPPDVRKVRFDETIDWSEDIGWTWEVEDWAMERYELYAGGCGGEIMLPSSDGVFFYLKPPSLSGKYRHKRNYHDVYGDYVAPLSPGRVVAREKRKLIRGSLTAE